MNEKERGILILHSPTDIDKSKGLQYVGERRVVVFSGTRTVTLMTNLINGHLAIANEVFKSVRPLFKDKGFEGCRTPEPFRNDKGIYRQHKRQRKHK